MIRLSVTWLDMFASYMDDEEQTAEAFAMRLFGPFEPTLEMRAGTALHSVLEHAKETDDLVSILRSGADGFSFTIDEAVDGVIELGDSREQKYLLNILPDVVLSGRIDAETALYPIDHKLTGQFDAERYMNSLQWKAYLLMRNKRRFVYQVFERGPIVSQDGFSHCHIKDYHRLEVAAYPHMMSDVREVAAGLAEFVKEWKPRFVAAS